MPRSVYVPHRATLLDLRFPVSRKQATSDALKPELGLTRVDVIRVAGLVPCDPRTVTNYLRGAATSHAAAAGIRTALRTLGLADPRAPHSDRGSEHTQS